MNVPHYKVGDRIFFNRYLAWLESLKTAKPFKFVLYENAFDTVDWQEPVESWDTLLDQRAQQLASMGRPIILGFSGGTDSLTIYKVFRRNNIQIWGTVTKARNDLLSRDVVPFIQAEGLKHGFKVLIIPQNTLECERQFSDPDWVFKDHNPRLQLGMNTHFDLKVHQEFFKLNINEDYIHVTGLEKPRLFVYGGKFYSYQEDTAWSVTSDSRLHGFFISPDFPKLHVKQSHMLARYIKKLAHENNCSIDQYQNAHRAVDFDYHRYSYEGCGRYGDLAFSDLQKIANWNSRLTMPNFDIKKITVTQGFKDANIIEAALKDNTKFIKNYIAGLQSLRSDSRLNTIFMDRENYFSVRNFRSKAYELF